MSFQSNIIGLCAVAIVLLVPPFVWHTKCKNIPAIILILWLFIMDFTFLVSAAIWGGEDFATRWSGKGWCDIVTKLQIGANVGISCAVTNIVFNLHVVLRADQVLPDVNSWRKIGSDLAICLITPIIVMGLSYLVQFSRFGIARYNGCANLLSPTWVTTVLYTMWALIWSAIAAIYAILVLFIFYKKRKDVRDILHCTNSKLNVTRFSRLLIFCFLIILVIFPLAIYAVVEDAKHLQGSYSFKETHSKFFWRTIPKFDEGKSMFSVWLYILMSFMVFFIFGLGSDALRLYAEFLRKIKLGFIVAFIEDSIQRNKKNRIAKVLSQLSPSSDSQDTSFSDSSLEKGDDGYSTYQSSSAASNSNFYVDYGMPGEARHKNTNGLTAVFKSQLKYSAAKRYEYVNDKRMPFAGTIQVAQDVSTDSLPRLTADLYGVQDGNKAGSVKSGERLVRYDSETLILDNSPFVNWSEDLEDQLRRLGGSS